MSDLYPEEAMRALGCVLCNVPKPIAYGNNPERAKGLIYKWLKGKEPFQPNKGDRK